MTPDEIQQIADLLAKTPGTKGVDLKDVKRLVELLRASPEVGSIEVKGMFGTGVVITRTAHGLGVAPMMAQGMMPSMPPVAPAGESPTPLVPASPLKEIKSPMVGTYYSCPEPGAEAYVRVGQRVTPGQTVCIVEAMKIMNEIEAELSGVVREICVDDAQPVEYGQVLFRVDPNG
ncbi:MAG: acetyl-CoA carboxylase biotin carboxyl carrier protein [Gemmatimonadota bacterium]